MQQHSSRRVELLQDAIDYLHSFREDCRTQNEHEDLTISLRLLAVLLRNEARSCDPFTLACYLAVGSSPAVYRERRAVRDEFKLKELIGAIPDYDPGEAKQIEEARKRRVRPLSIRDGMLENTLRPLFKDQ